MASQQTNYIITNRSRDIFGHFDDALAANGDLTYTTAAEGSTSFSIAAQAAFTQQLESDLTNVAGESGNVQLCIFVHGFHTSWPGMEQQWPLWGGNLAGTGGYEGVVVAFDWPSGDYDIDYYGAKERAARTGTESFPQLAAFLQGVVADLRNAGITVTLQVLCHSMGNFVMWNGAEELATKPALPVSEILLVAAELSNDTFAVDPPDPNTPGQAIASLGANVTVYYSGYDDVLPIACTLDKWAELGLVGPVSGHTLFEAVTGLDCTAVVNPANAGEYNATEVHTAYFVIPEVLQDMAMTLMGEASTYRTPLAGAVAGREWLDPAAGSSGS
ncbi:MAG: alpha/beta hydrolase [Bacteroidetes bacterium]|nr:alpha/beta hydrolase [Bacteroidota bacterium]